MAQSTCSLPECDKPYYRTGYCAMHDARVRRHGDPYRVLIQHGSTNLVTMERKSRAAARRKALGTECELSEYGMCSKAIVIHHANENPLDNRPENLRVLCNRHHILHHRGNFDLDNPDHSRYYVTKKGALRRRKVA